MLRNVTRSPSLRNVTRSPPYWAVESLSFQQIVHSSMKKMKTIGWQPQIKRWTRLKSTRQLRVVLGPSVAKTTRQQPQKGSCIHSNPTQGKSTVPTSQWNDGNNLQSAMEKKPNSQHGEGKHRHTTKPQKDFCTCSNPTKDRSVVQSHKETTGMIHSPQMGKEPILNLCVRVKGHSQSKTVNE